MKNNIKMFKEFEIKKGVTLRNKFVVAPMTTWASNDDLTVSDGELDYYTARSKEAGMVITASAHVQAHGQAFYNQIYGGDDAFIPSLKKLADSIKSQGAKAILQLQHAGRQAIVEVSPIVSASAVKAVYNPSRPDEEAITPRALTNDEIEEIIESFYQATRRAIEAGFDGVELHGANTYLLQQFFSPHSNRRDDKWGGTVEKRMTFPLSVIDAAARAKKDFASENFIIGYRISPEERENPGITIDDTLIFVDRLTQSAVDYLHASLLNYKTTSIRDENDTRLIGKLLHEKIDGRKTLIGLGGIQDLKEATEAHNTVGYDLIAIGRGILYDPHWISKQTSGEPVLSEINLENIDKQHIPEQMGKFLKDFPLVKVVKNSEKLKNITMNEFKIYDVETSPEGSKKTLKELKDKFGFIPNFEGVIAESPELLEAYELMTAFFMKTSFNNEEKIVVWQTINVEHECNYCVPAYTAVAKLMKVDNKINEALRNRTKLPNEKLQVLHETTLSLVRNRGKISKDEMERFFAVGYTKRHLLEVILGISQKMMSNYVNHFTETPLDSYLEKFAWEK